MTGSQKPELSRSKPAVQQTPRHAGNPSFVVTQTVSNKEFTFHRHLSLAFETD
jgi:hypothetical protein